MSRRRKPPPDLSDSGGEVVFRLSSEAFDEIDRSQNLTSEQKAALVLQMNRAVHFLVKEIASTEIKVDARARKVSLNPADDIVEAAQRLDELIQNGPLVISNNPELLAISSLLSDVPHIIKELAANPDLAVLGIDDPLAGKVTDVRRAFVEDAHEIYHRVTGKTDWITSSEYDDSRYTNSFFALIKTCYSAAGVSISDHSIREDIAFAKAAGANPESKK